MSRSEQVRILNSDGSTMIFELPSKRQQRKDARTLKRVAWIANYYYSRHKRSLGKVGQESARDLSNK